MDADVLKCIPLEQWPRLKMEFKNDWPRSISGFTVLDNEEHITKQGLDYGFKVYCPYGDTSKGMIAINTKVKKFHEIIIQHAYDETTDIEYALRNTKYINWSKNFEFSYMPKHITECVKRLVIERNLKINYLTITETFVLNTKIAFDVKLPSDLNFDLITLEYINLIDSMWPHRYDSSDWYYELLTKAKLGYGLFKGKELIAWVFVKDMGALGHLYTMENYRRKGYGEMVLKLVSNILRERGKIVFAFCVKGNISARNLFIKLGFDKVQEVNRYGIKGKENNS